MNKTKVPFSWENKPGISKVMMTTKQQHHVDGGSGGGGGQDYKHVSTPKLLPPPPCPAASGRLTSTSNHDIQIPLPPCPFQPPPSRSSSRKGLKMMNMKQHDQDPFLVAFKECTKTSTRKGNKLAKNNYKGMFNFSCKRSCSVRDDNLLRVSQLPCKKDGNM